MPLKEYAQRLQDLEAVVHASLLGDVKPKRVLKILGHPIPSVLDEFGG